MPKSILWLEQSKIAFQELLRKSVTENLEDYIDTCDRRDVWVITLKIVKDKVKTYRQPQ